jgi:hypothetical protein
MAPLAWAEPTALTQGEVEEEESGSWWEQLMGESVLDRKKSKAKEEEYYR